MDCSQPPRSIGCAQPPTWGWSFYSSFGGLTKKFRTNLDQKRRSASFHSSLTTPKKKFRTIAGQRLHTTHPEPPATYRRITRGLVSQGIYRAVAFELSRTNPLRRICLRHISHGHFAHLRKHRCSPGSVSNLPERRDRAAKTTSPNRRTAGRSHATTPPAGGLRATGLVARASPAPRWVVRNR
ncbi:hypothetical protein CCANI_05990 [Corynebacterium canis]|nr:hypothetical protein CCANI_05990 [Corynebacterium canis]